MAQPHRLLKPHAVCRFLKTLQGVPVKLNSQARTSWQRNDPVHHSEFVSHQFLSQIGLAQFLWKKLNECQVGVAAARWAAAAIEMPVFQR